jgi:peptide/nickel transport system substrate-binding protein
LPKPPSRRVVNASSPAAAPMPPADLHRLKRRGVLAVMTALPLLPILPGGGFAAGEPPVPGGTLTVGLATDTAIIDPSITGSSITALITRNVVDSLVGQAEDNSFTPWLAKSWDINGDHTVYTFHLVAGVTFSDGTPLDAVAVKFNFDRILDPKTTSSYAKSLLGPVDNVEAPDPLTVIVSYKQPFSPLLQALSLPYLGIQSSTHLRAATSTTNSVVGSGPFVLDRFAPGSGSQLSRRADYKWGPGYASHKGPAYLDKLVFRYLPEASVRLGALTSGQVQAIDEVPPANFRSVKASDQLQVLTRENPGVNSAYFLNTSKGPFTDVKVRQAFQSSVGVASVVKAAFFGSLKPADNILGPSTLYYSPTVASGWGYNLDKAAQLLDAAGWTQTGRDGIRTKDGHRLTVRFVYDTAAGGATAATLAQAIQFSVKKAGFDLQLDPVDAGTYTARTGANDYDIVSFYFVRADPDILRTVFYSGYIPPNGSAVTRVKSLDDRLITAIGAPDAERKRIYTELQQEIIDQAYAVPIYVAAYQLGVSRRLNGIHWATNAKPLFYDAWLAA